MARSAAQGRDLGGNVLQLAEVCWLDAVEDEAAAPAGGREQQTEEAGG